MIDQTAFIDWNGYVPDDGKRQYFCCDCGSLILGGILARTIEWWPGAGPGDVHNCIVPYCPKCEPEKEFRYGPGLPESALREHICPRNW